jgi:uncharacterized phage-associated protein
MNRFTESDRIKLGNAVVYIATRVSRLSKTKLLKLLYLMEEYSVVRFKTPFLGLEYEVWQAGPVAKEVFIDLSETPILLDGFIERVHINHHLYIKATAPFSDDEFSDNDLIVMDDVIKKYGHCNAHDLVALTHRQETLWYKTALRTGMLEEFEKKHRNSSNVTIDLSENLTACDREFYREQLEFLNTTRQYAY